MFESDGALFAERFAGQVLTYAGTFDVLTGMPSNPLRLQVGLANQNLRIYYTTITQSQVLVGNGPPGWPDYDSIAEGSFAVLFDYDQAEFGFQLLGGDGGPATVDFFRRDGTLIDSIEIPNITVADYGFQRVGGTGAGAMPTHTYAMDGTYEVSLCVTDDEGLRSCCSGAQVVATDETTWDAIKAQYRQEPIGLKARFRVEPEPGPRSGLRPRITRRGFSG